MIHVQGGNNLKAEQAQSFCTLAPYIFVKMAATGNRTFEDFSALQSYKSHVVRWAHIFIEIWASYTAKIHVYNKLQHKVFLIF